ncbi:BBE domain-containing protein [Streptomyces roseus]|uniref:BBE domain-containing protein n=1 Tax=Streptomyces roseus TaxID=66430 RepID=UPI0036746E9C
MAVREESGSAESADGTLLSEQGPDITWQRDLLMPWARSQVSFLKDQRSSTGTRGSSSAWTPPGRARRPATVAANLRWPAEPEEAVAPYVGPGADQNFIDPDLADWRTAYDGANHPRLVEIKKPVDPDGFFTFGQSIGS